MERIRLSKLEKQVFLHVKEHGEKQPRSIAPVMFPYCLSTLREKELIEFKTNYDEVVKAGLTIKGATWTFIHHGERFKMPVKDDALMEQIDKRQQFGKGDAIKVRMRITKRYNSKYKAFEISSRRIVAFYELIKRDGKSQELIDEE